MIIYVTMLTTTLSLLVLAMVYLADFWEREPLDFIQNAFLAGLGVQLVLVLGGHQLAGIDAWTGWHYPLTLAAFALFLPILLAEEKEVDEAFDGIVYSVAFAAGAASVVHLYNLPGAVAQYPASVVLEGDATPGARDLLLLISSPGARAELADLLVLLLVSALAGAALGTLKLQGRPLQHQIGAMLVTGVLLAGIDVATGGWWPVRLVLVAAVVGTGAVLKRGSAFRERRPPPEREVFLGALKTGLMIFGAIAVALALLMSLTDSWQVTKDPSTLSLFATDGSASP